MNTRRLQQSGFTLIEVLVALVIVALSLTAIASSMAQMIDAAHQMRDRSYASWIAQNKIAEMRLENVIPEVAATSGDVQFAGTNWDWRAVVSDTGVENLFRVDVTVSYPDSESGIRTVTGFIGEPVMPGLSSRSWYIRGDGNQDGGPTE